ncbi:hypothetical protein GALL_424620 [mine drainage metagenome]|uniref:Uncharacterized protein n=1 Tax=mine drainage metagenome TaxID=410659 RepID=A0A1J5QED3_9ZZZZ
MAPSKKLPTWRPTSKLSCTTPPAITAGPAMVSRRLRSGVMRGQRSLIGRPMRTQASQTRPICAKPVMGVVQLSVRPMFQW